MIRIQKLIFCISGFIMLIIIMNSKVDIFTPHTDQTQLTFKKRFTIAATDPATFISVWNTSLTSWDSSATNQVHLPLVTDGIYNFSVNWGDGIISTITTWNQPTVIHTYSTPGAYTLVINGTIIGWRFNGYGDCMKIIEIQQWGCLQLGNLGSYFYGCWNLILTASDYLILTDTTNLYQMFFECVNLGDVGNLNEWDVSRVTNMQDMFRSAYTFNQPIGNWIVSNVTNMMGMFYDAHAFNQPIGDWDVSNVTYMKDMFCCAYEFNQPIGNWDVSNVMMMQDMFRFAYEFNQPIGDWDVSNVVDIGGMFYEAYAFNQPIGNWVVSNVVDMSGIFQGAIAFNQLISDWNISSVKYMSSMFYNALAFNQSIGNWDVSNVQNTNGMFHGALAFNQSIGNWDVSNVNYMHQMFYFANAFNQPIGDWDVSNVRDMHDMFSNANTFDQPIGDWDVSSVTDMSGMFHGVTLSTANYDHLLLGWSQLTLQRNVEFDAGHSQYSTGEAASARQQIIDNFNWIITDGVEIIITTTTTTTTTTDTTSSQTSTTTTPNTSTGDILGYPLDLTIIIPFSILLSILVSLSVIFIFSMKLKKIRAENI